MRPLDYAHISDPTHRTALLVFARTPAAELAKRGWPRRFAPLLKSLAPQTKGLALDVHVFSDGDDRSVSPCGQFHPQVGTGFGGRLCNAVETLAESGYDNVIIVGSDCPDVTADDIVQARDFLRHSEAVFGPDHRGGTYLIGLRIADRAILAAVVWQRNTDFQQLQTLYAGRPIALLPVKIDLDSWSDLKLFSRRDGALHRWLARQLAWLAATTPKAARGWVDLMRLAENARHKTSPPCWG